MYLSKAGPQKLSAFEWQWCVLHCALLRRMLQRMPYPVLTCAAAWQIGEDAKEAHSTLKDMECMRTWCCCLMLFSCCCDCDPHKERDATRRMRLRECVPWPRYLPASPASPRDHCMDSRRSCYAVMKGMRLRTCWSLSHLPEH